MNLITTQIISKLKVSLDDNSINIVANAIEIVLQQYNIEMKKSSEIDCIVNNKNILRKYIAAKCIEGCSPKTLNYYQDTINKVMTKINNNIIETSKLAIQRDLLLPRLISGQIIVED